ncbi:spore germination protein [Gottfriedia sp. NPDC057991]|uniref:spore germination protein n=1 Tax=Gottfriedia sp. NPDC057991 TaxID=3346298 RepID=UPI0036D97A95
MKTNQLLENTEKTLREMFFNSSDFKSTQFQCGGRQHNLFYLDTMIESKLVQEYIIQPLLHKEFGNVRERVSILDYSETKVLTDVANAMVGGSTVLQIEGESIFYLLNTESTKQRQISIPLNERSLRGSNEALNENLNTNLNILRRLVATPDLVVKSLQIGKKSNTNVSVLYLQSLANDVVIMEFERRIASIDIDYLEAPGFVQELINEKKFSLFPKYLVSERPDRVRSYLMDGKIAILTDGSPDCLILPVSFWAFFQTPDDYHIGWLMGSGLRLLRIISFLVGISLPGLYVALVTFDPRIIPFEIVLTLQNSMYYVPMPPILEAITMLLILEVLREATVRLPSPIGQTIGVVGGIVIGTVVVQTNLISNMMVVVVALTAIASFNIPSYEMSSATRFLTYFFIILAACFGLIGVEIAFLILIIHLSSLDTMGIPYFYVWNTWGAIKDTLFRGPIGWLKKRSLESMAKDETRMKTTSGSNK